jgi:hypothetical protein
MTPGAGFPLGDALCDALVRRARRTGSAVTVGDPDDGLFAAVERGTNRVVPARGAGSRLLLGVGVAAATTAAVVLAEPASLAPRAAPGGVTAVVRDAATAETLRHAGWTVAQPVWPRDVEPLLDAALAAEESVVLRLHERRVEDADVPPPVLGTPRVLAEGRTGVVVAAGALVAEVRAVRPGLRRKGLELAVVDAHTRVPHGPGTALAEPDTHVLAGGPQAAAALAAGRLRPGVLHAVAVPEGADLGVLIAEHVPLHG